jgi:hypothetical protein
MPTDDPRVRESDSLQAAYFRGALVDHRAAIAAEIARQTRKLGSLTTKTDALTISRLRREIRANEGHCHELDRMIAAHDRRFTPLSAGRP